MRELLITVLCVCSVSGFRIFPVRSVEIITEGAVAETLVIPNQPTTVAAQLVSTSVLSTDSTSPSLSYTASKISSSPDTTVDSGIFSDSSPWSISNFVNADDSRPDKIAPSSKGSLGIAHVPVTTIATIQHSESPSLSNATATSSFVTMSTNTEQSNTPIEPPETSLSKSDAASSAFKVSETTTPTESDAVSTSEITEELSSSTEPPSLNLSKSDTTITFKKNSEVISPMHHATSTTLKDSKATVLITSTERATTHSKSVSTLTTTELSSSSSEPPATSSSKPDTTSPNFKNSEATTPITTDYSVAETSEPVSTDSLKSKPSASNSLSTINEESSSTAKPESVLSSAASELASTGSEEPTTESIIIVETTTQDLSFLSLNLLPPKTEYRKNEPDPRYDY